MLKVISKAQELTFDPRSTTPMPLPRSVLMVRPTYFNLDTPINPHMRKADGSLHVLDKNEAFKEWEYLKANYEKLGLRVKAIEGGDGLPDMVFSANQSLPYVDRVGNKKAILSNMATETRHKEVPLIANALRQEGYEVAPLATRTPETLFEGMGDCLWLPGRRFLLGGYGHRTAKATYEKIMAITEAPVAIFELVNPRFYHLDTCLSVLNDSTALACKDAFSNEGWELLNKIFPNIIAVEASEADSPRFACNAHCPDGKHVLIQPGAVKAESEMRKAGFVPVPIETKEFIKSGGSVFCMKLMFF